MINFNHRGHLVPNISIPTSVKEFKRQFVDLIDSDTRLIHYKSYIKYSEDLKKILGVKSLKQWINGSFVTKIKNPADIDLVTFLDFRLVDKFEEELMPFIATNSVTNYAVDAYIVIVYPEEHSKYPLFDADKKYWINKFDKTRRTRAGIKHPKGFLEINY